MRAMNLNSYRFSISWPRISALWVRPREFERHRLLQSPRRCLAGSRNPPVLLRSTTGTCPQVLEDAGGWTNRDTSSRFADYVELASRAWGDRVSDWMLFNEPSAFVDLGHLEGTHAPGRKSLLDFLRASHTVNLAQGAGFEH